MFAAAKTNDHALALDMCHIVMRDNLFIGEKAKPTGHEKHIPHSEFPGRCNSCGAQIPVGVAIYWGKGVGQWHEECYK